MGYRHVVEISDSDLTEIESQILELCIAEGFIIPPNLTHIVLTALFKQYVEELTWQDTLYDFISEGGLDEVLETNDGDEDDK